MLKRAVSIGLVLVLVAPSMGCHSATRAMVPAAEPPSPYFEAPIYGLTTRTGREVTFDEPAEIQIHGIAIADARVRSSLDEDIATVNGTVRGVPCELPLSDVELIWFGENELSKGKTAALLGAIGGFFVVVIVGMILQGRNNEGA